MLKQHAQKHSIDGEFECPECEKKYPDFPAIRKHMHAVHQPYVWQCTECNKAFSRADKYKMHMLKHSNVREYMCDMCGKQFKRKDKLKEHVKRIHETKIGPAISVPSAGSVDVLTLTNLLPDTKPYIIKDEGTSGGGSSGVSAKFVPKVPPTNYERFIYKCHRCMLGFKRRGMLVNHLAKRHPDQKPDSIPELTLPILRTQRDFYCQYCDKVYKSSSKRKTHILKNHPGSLLPPSARNKCDPDPSLVAAEALATGAESVLSANFSAPIMSITTQPSACQFCHKQYASRAKLLQHQRRHHPDHAPPLLKKGGDIDVTEARTKVLTAHVLREPEVPSVGAVTTETTDLLTQAMTELTQSLNTTAPEYRSAGPEFQIIDTGTSRAMAILQPVVAAAGGAAAGSGTGQTTATIDLSQLGPLGQTLLQGVTPQQQQSQQQQQGVLQTQNITIINNGSGGQTQMLMPVSIGGQTAYISRTWAEQAGFQTAVKYSG